MNKTEIDNFARVTKKQAEKFFLSGKTIRLTSSNLSPTNIWGAFVDINKKIAEENDETLPKILNAFSYYNCNYQSGKYISFWIDKEQMAVK